MSATVFAKKPTRGRTRTISVTSGKGGVGKSTLVTNLALSLTQSGQSVLVLDGDLGMANVDVMFGIRTQKSIEHVLSGECSMSEIIVSVAPRLSLIPGGSGVYGLQNMSAFHKKLLLDQVSELSEPYDFMMIDTASGIDENVLYLNSAAQEVLIVVTPEPASLTDAYALIKVLNKKFGENRFSIVTNMVQDESEALYLYRRLSDVAGRFLCVSLDYKGFVPHDPNLRNATKSQQLVTQVAPMSPSALAIRELAQKVSEYAPLATQKGGMQFFWEQLVGVA